MTKSMDQAYLRALFADEVELAGLLKYYKVSMPPDLTPTTWLYPKRRDTSGARDAIPVPRWRREWQSAGPLLGRYGLSIAQNTVEGSVTAFSRTATQSVTERFADHPDEQLAIMAAIVRTVILCLQGVEISQ
ncbi:hypothetical protein NX774_12050 [Massilia agilis]|uniref:Uncharacterized protein n=1 Tax=Massilia agilis TaxID=1811226 RepID=A0ABT2DBW3_9BURK|nr:hypothetical protein [Massilia agilis]MCS0808652.1 hypothetical protein [Massilia agilis]